MEISEEDLAAVRTVLSGELNRATLLNNIKPGDSQTHIFIVAALLLASEGVLTPFRKGEYEVKGSYGALLDKLLAAGTGKRHGFPIEGRRSTTSLTGVSRKMNMHRTQGKGGGKKVYLCPPMALVRLAAEYADSPAVRAFFEEADAAVEAENQRREAYRRATP